MKNVELVHALLDAGKDFRIAEQMMAEVPINPPVEPSNPDHWAQWQERLHEWKQSKAQAEAALNNAASRYLGLLFDAVSDQVESYIQDHEYDQHKMHRSEPGDD